MVGTKWDVWSPMLKALRCFPPLGSMKDSFNFSEYPLFYLNCLSGCGTKCSGFSPQLGHCPATDPGAGPMQLEGLGEHTVHSGSNPLRGSFHQKGTKESKKRWGSTVFCCTFPLSLTRSWSFFLSLSGTESLLPRRALVCNSDFTIGCFQRTMWAPSPAPGTSQPATAVPPDWTTRLPLKQWPVSRLHSQGEALPFGG